MSTYRFRYKVSDWVSSAPEVRSIYDLKSGAVALDLRLVRGPINAAPEVTLNEEIAAGAAVQKTSAELRFEGILEDEQAP